jgi:8-oxo-dGTP diphosphatase
VVTGYVLDRAHQRVLLLFHKKLQMWLPAGGHVEATEDPARAVLREVQEETGLRVKVLGRTPGGMAPRVLMLPTPHHVQVEVIDGVHEHIDLVYACEVVSGRLRESHESEGLRWFSREDLRSSPVGPNVRFHARSLLRRGR